MALNAIYYYSFSSFFMQLGMVLYDVLVVVLCWSGAVVVLMVLLWWCFGVARGF